MTFSTNQAKLFALYAEMFWSAYERHARGWFTDNWKPESDNRVFRTKRS